MIGEHQTLVKFTQSRLRSEVRRVQRRVFQLRKCRGHVDQLQEQSDKNSLRQFGSAEIH